MNKGVIYQGNSIISIETLPDYAQPVVIKKPAKPHASRRHILSLEKEYEMTRTLDGLEGVRRVLEQQSIENQPALVLEYIEGETLRATVAKKTVSLREKLKIAVDLARILGRIHQQNVFHLDLNSKNILIGNEPQAVRLIDLGSAAHIDRSGQQKVRPDQLLGTLPYISPEQTGRINRAVDERSDLYSLGVVLYELMTRQLPFDSEDPLKLVHDHITRVPISPSEVSSEIPEVLSAIILKLLSKNAEDRYQSAAGVRADLEKCLQHLSPEDTLEEFPLGDADFAGRLRFPQKLYARDRELKALESAFERVCRNTASIVFVGGYSGIGKTALVEEIQRPVSEKSGYFIEGKFDQLVTTPYAGITQAFAQFVSQILTQTETQLAAWRSKILEAVGPNGRLLTDVVPSLELVIGPQPAVPDLSGLEAQNRFNYVFQRFFGAIARREHPICLFLDDLQWIDPASLHLLKALFSSPDLAFLLVVGTYRENDVRKDHPLMTLITDLEKADANLRRMTLPKLSEADVDALISDALRCDPDEIRKLSRLVYSQTNGNPFFTRQVLRSMEDQGLIVFDTASGHWRWDMYALSDLDVTASVVELLVGKLKELPVDIQETLKVAACIGSQFEIATLTVVTAGDDDAILDQVRETVAAGLIWESSDHCYFVHDRVQEAAYALMSPEDRDRTHLTIGRHLLQRPRASDHEHDLYQIVDQLNHGLHLVEDEQERMQLARLNLQAARAAAQTNAFETGLNYAKAGIELLGENSWEGNYRLTLGLHEQAALLARLTGKIPDTEYHSEQVLQYSLDPLDTVRVQGMRTEFLSHSNRIAEAFDLGLEALSILGQEFPKDPDWRLAVLKVSEMEDRLVSESPDFLAIPPLLDKDPELTAITEILVQVASAAYVHRPALAPIIMVRFLELCLERQLLPPVMPWVIAGHGVWVISLLGKAEAAYGHGQTALQLASLEPCAAHLCSALSLHGGFLHFWRGHLRESLDFLLESIRVGHDYGNNYIIAYSSQHWSKHAIYASIELDRVVEQSTQNRAFLDSRQFDMQTRWINIFISAAQALRGSRESSWTSWHGDPFDDDRDLPGMHRQGDKIGLLFLYTAKAWVAAQFGDHDGVENYSDLARRYLEAGPGLLDTATLPFVCGLRYARELRENPEQSESEQALEEQLSLLERFAGLAPMNFAHKLSLVQAEAHRARGEVVQAMQSYEKASQGARENDYLNEAGLAHALAAEFLQDLGLRQAALHNAKQAAQAWRSWGAHALVESLGRRLPDLLEPSDLSWQSSSDAGKIHTAITPIQLDIESLISASQMLSAETDLEQLLTKMITLVMANSGAETAVLLLKQDNDWFVQARGDSASEKYDVLLNQPFEPVDIETDLIPESVFNYCQRTEAVLVVGDVKLDDRFAEDRMIREHKVQSMACIPALSQGELKGMLYLENRQMADVFTLENVGILKHLSAQFAVSVENALLYDNLNQKMRELQESQEELARHQDHLEVLVEERTAQLQQEVAERKQAELALQQSNQALNQRLDELSMLNLIGQTVSTVVDLPEALDLVVATITRSFDALGTGIVLLSHDRSELTLVSFFDRRFPVFSIAGKSGDVPTNSGQRGMVYPVDEDSSLMQALLGQGQTTVISDAQHDPRLAPAHPILQAGQVGCLMLVPLLSQGKAIGLIGIATDQPEREFTPDEVKLAETIAGQIAGAIETARLFEQVEKSAITEERNRLAHELHDAVTQTIFSASVIAEATPRIWHKDPALAKRNLDQLTSMLRGALAELRTMLLELRPDTIQSKSVGQLLQTVVDASQPRINAPISLTVDGDRILPLDVTIALHRVGQEALNNVGKHAEASQVEIKLVCHQSQVSLSIRDNGRGFDPQPARAGHFGLESMAERLETIGGRLSIDSKPGQGTVISAHWSEPEGRSPHE